MVIALIAVAGIGVHSVDNADTRTPISFGDDDDDDDDDDGPEDDAGEDDGGPQGSEGEREEPDDD